MLQLARVWEKTEKNLEKRGSKTNGTKEKSAWLPVRTWGMDLGAARINPGVSTVQTEEEG